MGKGENMKILVVNGPNLNFLGIREKGVYGNETYTDLVKFIGDKAEKLKIDVVILQSNSEGEIIDFLQKAYYEKLDGVVINPGAYTHYSYAIYDAVKSISIPTVEVHLSDIQNREEFRKISVIAPACVKQIAGKGKDGYIEAIKYLKDMKK